MARYPIVIRFTATQDMDAEIKKRAKEKGLTVSRYLRYLIDSYHK